MSDPGDAALWVIHRLLEGPGDLPRDVFQTEGIQMKRESRQANKEGTN